MVERTSTDLQDQLEALQDEVNLLKNEVKQTLVDLREFIMKDRTLLPPHVVADGPQGGAPPRPPGTGHEGEDVFLIKSGTRFDYMTYSNGGATKTWTGDLEENNLSWGRGDTLNIQIVLLTTDAMGADDHVLQFVTPNGISAELTFEK